MAKIVAGQEVEAVELGAALAELERRCPELSLSAVASRAEKVRRARRLPTPCEDAKHQRTAVGGRPPTRNE
jgi:hypothetical protein